MGVVNVTPDSFSDGGMWLDPDDAISHARGLVDQGADIVDIGGESTRPGVARTPQAEELRRVVPIVSALADSGAVISVDTMRAEVARAAIGAGAQIINDVSGGLADRGILPVVADADVDYVVMHWRGPSATMQSVELTHYDNLVDDVVAELSERVADAERAGVARSRIIVDPGIGFSKNGRQNWRLLQAIDTVQEAFADLRLLWGVSRKGFLGGLLHDPDPRPPLGRDAATQALTCWCAAHHAWAVRTHEVRGNRDACEVFARLRVSEGA
ncbi:dihydropteroate synthase [Acidipropionibacterium jensenii]|uniref:dihydropteroate synthase n=1 Tax=Acidipropionibacterium jensenii TaxID=1749 RepID=UPI000BC31FF7